MISVRLAPIEPKAMNDFTPNVLGKSHPMYFHTAGIALSGHDIPETKSMMTLVNTTASSTSSRRRKKLMAAIAKKMQAVMYDRTKTI